MAVTAFLYGSFIGKLANKEIDLDTDTFKVMLCTSTYTPAQDTHDYKDDVTNEVAGTGYTATGATLASVTWAYTSGTNTWKFDAADTSWAASTITARYAVVYCSTPATDATRPLVGYVDFGGDIVSSGGAYDLAWNAAGIFTATVA